MSDAYIGEIRMFAGTFAPLHWVFCDGQLISVASNQALFSVLGTTYGGDGRTTFGLPEMRGRLPVHFGTGAGLTTRAQGSRYGQEYADLVLSQIPTHTHSVQASGDTATTSSTSGSVLATQQPNDTAYGPVTDPTKVAQMKDDVVRNTGGGQAHYNMMPYQCINFIICVEGLYPPRN